MPFCALPDGFKDTAEGTNTDWNNPIQKKIPKHWFAFGPRCAPGITWGLMPIPLLILWVVIRIFHHALPWSWWALWPVLPIPLARQWREFPILILGIFGPGFIRWEGTDGKREIGETSFSSRVLFWKKKRFTPSPNAPQEQVYLSAVQYWSKWHFQIEWPLFVAFHYNRETPPTCPNRPNNDEKLINAHAGCRRDADRVFWWPSFFAGTKWI